MTDAIPTHETTIVWRNPDAGELPAFNTRLLFAIGSWRDEGRGFHEHVIIVTGKVLQEDADGDEDEGEKMIADINSGDCAWDNCQFRLVDDEGEDVDTSWGYSDSIGWWAEIPKLPPIHKISAE